MRDDELTQQRGLALAQGQRGHATELAYLGQQLGEDNKTALAGKKKENGCRVVFKTGKSCAIKTGLVSEDWDMEQDDGLGL